MEDRRRFIALGDSFTEGVGDPHQRLPNGVRGWADRVADRLAKAEPGWEYANLAIRSKRLGQIVDEQLAPALALRPTLITLYAGGNDILDLGTDMADLIARYEALVDALATTGASLVLFTGFDIPGLPAPRMFVRRNRLYNSAVRRIARERGGILVDYWRMQEFGSPVLWASDRMHLSTRGHRVLAGRVLDTLGVPHSISTGPWEAPEPLSLASGCATSSVGRPTGCFRSSDASSAASPSATTSPPAGPSPSSSRPRAASAASSAPPLNAREPRPVEGARAHGLPPRTGVPSVREATSARRCRRCSPRRSASRRRACAARGQSPRWGASRRERAAPGTRARPRPGRR